MYVSRGESSVSVDSRELFCHFQPVFRVDGNIHGYEILAREILANGTHVFPKSLFETARQTGTLGSIDSFLRRIALEKFQKNAPENTKLFINMEPSQVRDMHHGLLPFVDMALDVGIEPSRLVVELTETEPMPTDAEFLEILDRVRCIGLKIAVDDFGTGYCDIDTVEVIKPDIVKISRECFRDIIEHHGEDTLWDLVAVLHEHSPQILVEGLETKYAVDVCRTNNVDLMQGYILGKPAPEMSIPDVSMQIRIS